MNIFDDIKLYLPKYLSELSMEDLLKKLKNFPNDPNQITQFDLDRGAFPNNKLNALYSNCFQEDDIIYQGDGLKDLLVVNLPDEKIGKAPVIVLSNTCDIDLNNSREYFPSQMAYATIFNLAKYEAKLIETKIKDKTSINSHIDSIRKQLITQILYLPIGNGLNYEGIVFLDRINHCDNKSINRTEIKNQRLFSLSNYGFYLFLIKLSIHFTRIQEKVDRK